MKTNGEVVLREPRGVNATGWPGSCSSRSPRACLAPSSSSLNIYATRIYRAVATLLTGAALGAGRAAGSKTKSALEELTFRRETHGPRTHFRQR